MLADVKRSAALAPLSRDHHHALAVSLRLRRATDDDAEEACRRFVAFMEADGERHFREEEAELLPHATPEMTERTLAEHATLRGRSASRTAPPPPASCTRSASCCATTSGSRSTSSSRTSRRRSTRRPCRTSPSGWADLRPRVRRGRAAGGGGPASFSSTRGKNATVEAAP